MQSEIMNQIITLLDGHQSLLISEIFVFGEVPETTESFNNATEIWDIEHGAFERIVIMFGTLDEDVAQKVIELSDNPGIIVREVQMTIRDGYQS